MKNWAPDYFEWAKWTSFADEDLKGIEKDRSLKGANSKSRSVKAAQGMARQAGLFLRARRSFRCSYSGIARKRSTVESTKKISLYLITSPLEPES